MTHTASEYLPGIGPPSEDGETCGLSLLPTPTNDGSTRKNKYAQGGTPLGLVISSAEDSLVSRYLLPAGVRLNVIRAGSGRISQEWFAYFDPDTSSWKTRQGCLAPEWETCLETFPSWGLIRNGFLYRRVPLVRPMRGKGVSLLPTPGASKAANDVTLQCSGDGRKKPNKLGWVAGMIPTPTVTLLKRGYSNQAERSLLCPSHAGGPINPAWIEHLMGLPIGWTELEGLAMR